MGCLDKTIQQKGQFFCTHKQLVGHRIHTNSTTSQVIENGMRYEETLEVFKRFWSEWFAKRLIKVYEIGDKSNDL